MIVNTDQTTGTGVTIRDLKLDGRTDRNSATGTGINLTNMGSESASRAGASVTRLQITRIPYDSIDITAGDHNYIAGNTIINSGGGGINLYSGSPLTQLQVTLSATLQVVMVWRYSVPTMLSVITLLPTLAAPVSTLTALAMSCLTTSQQQRLQLRFLHRLRCRHARHRQHRDGQR